MDYRLEQLRFELREDPSSRIFFKLGEHLRREGELQEAISVLGNGLEKHPKYVAAWVSLGRALLDAGSSRQAAEALSRALALDPENAVASRHAGEAAIANGEWVEAIKGLKRARALSAPDEQLDERIAFVEERLAELGQLEGPAAPAAKPLEPRESSPPEGRSLDVVFAESDEEFPSEDDSGDVFPADAADESAPMEEQTDDCNSRATMAIPIAEMPLPSAAVEQAVDASHEPAAEPEDEPVFEIDADAVIESEVEYDFGGENEAPGDGGSEEVVEQAREAVQVFDLEADEGPLVDSDDEDAADVESATVPVAVAEIESEAEPEPVFDLLPEDDGSVEDGGDTESSAPQERADFVDFEEETEVEEEPRAEELPLPTMTLARLALDQADLELAEKTLHGVLERNPDHAEAAELLAGLMASSGDEFSGGGVSSDATSDSRAHALRRWLAAVRLASERLKT